MVNQFEPNRLTFAQGIERVKKATSGAASLTSHKVVTSRDPEVMKAVEALSVDNVPGGFTKYQLPVFFEGGPGAQFFVSVGNPGAEALKHSHDEGDGLRFIFSGSIIYEGKELSGGDWMFIPKGQSYTFRVGRKGVVMGYCYQCCCA